ncbi:hypothetical protein BKA65DRAFT_278935 [Rhexocercosporidium sp. MPI-PUGE-AT-0058]|nr:hypothetical protein BKA65DRAFT_278935 [Rhexocercosporidium sp. MPI-PUGE-AT-0058]
MAQNGKRPRCGSGLDWLDWVGMEGGTRQGRREGRSKRVVWAGTGTGTAVSLSACGLACLPPLCLISFSLTPTILLPFRSLPFLFSSTSASLLHCCASVVDLHHIADADASLKHKLICGFNSLACAIFIPSYPIPLPTLLAVGRAATVPHSQ